MAQSYVLGKDYGGVAFLGNTRAGYYSLADSEETLTDSPKIEKNFVKLLTDGEYRLSEAEALSKEIYNFGQQICKHLLLTHNLHGDPELTIWPGSPQSLENVSVMRYNDSISVTDLPQQDIIIVTLFSHDDSACKTISTNGKATFNNVNPNSTIMVYHHNYLPYIAPLYLQNERIENSQYVIANDVWVGENVDSGRTSGNLTIAAGVEYELDAKGQVVLAPGFIVEKGALFSVTQSDY